MPASVPFGRLDSSRLLALGGICMVLIAMLLGEIYAIYISHVANGIIRQSWTAVVEAATQGNAFAVEENFAVIQDLTEKRGRTMNTHSHLGAFGLLALVLAFIQPVLPLTDRRKRQFAVMFLLGAVLQSGGVYVSYYVGRWAVYLADVGAVLFIIAVGGNLMALLSRQPAPSLSETLLVQLAPSASRFLVKAGLLLILAGMVFGLYYSWGLVSVDRPAVFSAIDATVEGVANQDAATAGESIAQFKRMQSKIAITAAAHSHAIEFGLIIILLAFIQRYVLLDDAWRLRWARVLVVGAYLLPVCVYLATMYGLRAAAFADLFGGMVMLGLIAMGFGIVRYTGAADLKSVKAE